MSTISALTALAASAAAADDQTVVDDTSAGATKKIAFSELLDAILRVADGGDVVGFDATNGKFVVRKRGGTPGTDDLEFSVEAAKARIDTVDARPISISFGMLGIQYAVGCFTQSPYRFGICSGDPAVTAPDTTLSQRTAGEFEVLNATTGRRDLAARTLIARQDGGVVGTDEVQVSHDGTQALVASKDGDLNLAGVGGILFQRTIDGAGVGSFYIKPGAAQIVASSNQAIGWTDNAQANAGTFDTASVRAAAGVIRDTDGSTGLGKRLTGTLVEANTAGSGSPNSLTAVESRTLLTNEGATAENYHTLPTAAAGLDFEFVCQDADGIRVTANTGDTIRDVATVSASAGYIRSSTIGSVIRLKAINATEWFVVYKQGTWTIDS